MGMASRQDKVFGLFYVKAHHIWIHGTRRGMLAAVDGWDDSYHPSTEGLPLSRRH